MPPAASFKKLGKLNSGSSRSRSTDLSVSGNISGDPAARWSGERERAEGPFKKLSDGPII